MQAYESVDGNARPRRRLLGPSIRLVYQLLRADQTVTDQMTFSEHRLRSNAAAAGRRAPFVLWLSAAIQKATERDDLYYIVTNHGSRAMTTPKDSRRRNDLLRPGNYIIRVFAGRLFWHNSYVDHAGRDKT